MMKMVNDLIQRIETAGEAPAYKKIFKNVRLFYEGIKLNPPGPLRA
jgi:hypothetical protein